MEYQITISPEGSVEYHVVSLLYDVWEDYNFYRREAGDIDKNADPLKYKRAVRSAVLCFFNYFEGVLNRWIIRLGTAQTILERMFFKDKLEIIETRPNVRALDFDGARLLRNDISHIQSNNSDLEIMDHLLNGDFFETADRLVSWMHQASARLQYECHPDVPAFMDTLLHPEEPVSSGNTSSTIPNSL